MRNKLIMALFIAASACWMLAKPGTDVNGTWTGELQNRESRTGKVRSGLEQKGGFSLEGGQSLGCLGPNGSGKSTTVKMITGLLKPSRGRVLFRGEDIRTDLVSYRKRLGYVPEEPNLYPYMSGREYLEMVGI